MIYKKAKYAATKKVAFFNEGDVVVVLDVDDESSIVILGYGKNFELTAYMGVKRFEESFVLLVIEDETDTSDVYDGCYSEYIDNILAQSKIAVYTAFEKCCIVSCKLPNGSVIVESYDFLDSEDYDADYGASACLDKIAYKIEELNTYIIQNELYCDDEYEDEFDDYEDNDFIEPDCEHCFDHNCEFNPNNHDNN